MSLYSPIKLRTNEAENWLKFKNSHHQLKNNRVTLQLYQFKYKVYNDVFIITGITLQIQAVESSN